VLKGILVGIIDASLLRKAMQSCSGVDIFGSPNTVAHSPKLRLVVMMTLARS
jgi:hypothetical protein